jgi:hypothetical protein
LRSRLRRLNIGASLDFDVGLLILMGEPFGGKHPLGGETRAQSTRRGTSARKMHRIDTDHAQR